MKVPSLVVILPSVGVFGAAKTDMAASTTIRYGISNKQLEGSPKFHFMRRYLDRYFDGPLRLARILISDTPGYTPTLMAVYPLPLTLGYTPRATPGYASLTLDIQISPRP
jgi:hypothetical protein